MLTVRTSENTVITSFRLISERQDFSSVRTGENTVRARARIHGENYQITRTCLVEESCLVQDRFLYLLSGCHHGNKSNLPHLPQNKFPDRILPLTHQQP